MVWQAAGGGGSGGDGGIQIAAYYKVASELNMQNMLPWKTCSAMVMVLFRHCFTPRAGYHHTSNQ